MAIECVHIYPYKQLYFDKGLDLPLRDYSRSQLAITNIEGLGPVDANINITPFAARDGGLFNSSRKQQRNITLTMKLFNDPSMESVREKIYSACPVGEPISLVFDYSDGYSKTIDGYVENNPVDYFGESEGIQVSIICPDPDLILVYKGDSSYTSNVNYKLVNYPNKQSLLDIGNELEIKWYETCKDETEIYSIDSILNIYNKTQKNQEYLIAMAFMLNNDDLSIIFFSNSQILYEKEINNYIDCPMDSEYEPDTYFIVRYYGYEMITSKEQFDYLTHLFLKLDHEEEFVENTFYKKKNLYESDKIIKVTWNADYDDQETRKYGYPVEYSFLQKDNSLVSNSNQKYILKNDDFDIYIPNFYYSRPEGSSHYDLVSSPDAPQDWATANNKYYRRTTLSGDEVSRNLVEDFKQNASYFTSASQLFSLISKKGTNLSSPTEFVENTFYRLKNVYECLDKHCGYKLVSNNDDIYFLDDLEKYCYSDGYFDKDVPLYTIYRIKKVYNVAGDQRDRTQVYYYIDSNGNEVSIPTSASTPSDFSYISTKYYMKKEIYDPIINYPEKDTKIIDGRSRYEVILDYLGYTYDQKIYGVAYEPGEFYEYIGDAGEDIEGMYGISELPLYHLMTGLVPEDWDTAENKYFTRRRRTYEENIYPIYINDHAFYKISDRNIYEYELLFEEPDDFQTNYENYYTISNDFSLIVAYFKEEEYMDYSLIYELLETMPSDFQTNYSKYYNMERVYSGIVKVIGKYTSSILNNPNSNNIMSLFNFIKDENGQSNYIFGDSKGLVYSYELKMPYDEYKPDVYYSYDFENDLYTLVTSSDAPEDFYTELYKYYKKVSRTENYIPSNVIIFYNPITKTLEYDKDQYDMFLNDFKSWSEHACSDILKIYRSDVANDKYVRKNNFITYKLNDEIINGELPYLKPGYNPILSTVISNNEFSYNPPKVIGISCIIK